MKHNLTSPLQKTIEKNRGNNYVNFTDTQEIKT